MWGQFANVVSFKCAAVVRMLRLWRLAIPETRRLPWGRWRQTRSTSLHLGLNAGKSNLVDLIFPLIWERLAESDRRFSLGVFRSVAHSLGALQKHGWLRLRRGGRLDELHLNSCSFCSKHEISRRGEQEIGRFWLAQAFTRLQTCLRALSHPCIFEPQFFAYLRGRPLEGASPSQITLLSTAIFKKRANRVCATRR